MSRKPASTPPQAAGKDVGAFDDRQPGEWATTLHDVREYGALMDGKTDDSKAVVDALADSTGSNEAAYIPGSAGTLYLANKVRIDAGLSGGTLVGDGYSSHMQSDEWVGIQLRDRGGPIRNVTLGNFRIEGMGGSASNKENQWGIRSWDDGHQTDNILIENCWVHDHTGAGIRIDQVGTTVKHCSSYANGHWHGIAANNEGPPMTPDIRIVHNLCWNNPGYGIDHSSGGIVSRINMVIGNGFRAGGGSKTVATSGDRDVVVERLHSEANSDGFIVLQPGPTDRLDRIVCLNNDAHGFGMTEGGTVDAGSLYAAGNGGNGFLLADDPLTLNADSLQACQNGSYGVNDFGPVDGSVGSVVGQNNGNGLVRGDSNLSFGSVSSGGCSVPDVIPARGGGGNGGTVGDGDSSQADTGAVLAGVAVGIFAFSNEGLQSLLGN